MLGWLVLSVVVGAAGCCCWLSVVGVGVVVGVAGCWVFVLVCVVVVLLWCWLVLVGVVVVVLVSVSPLCFQKVIGKGWPAETATFFEQKLGDVKAEVMTGQSFYAQQMTTSDLSLDIPQINDSVSKIDSMLVKVKSTQDGFNKGIGGDIKRIAG